MRVRLFATFTLCISAAGSLARAESLGHKLWRASEAVVITVQVTDSVSSHRISANYMELNPILGRSQYGYRQDAIKFGIVGGSLLIQELVVRKRPRLVHAFTTLNMMTTVIDAGAVTKNWRLK